MCFRTPKTRDGSGGAEAPTGPVWGVLPAAGAYLVLEELLGAVAEDGAEAVVVRRAAGVQAEVQTHHDGRQFVPEVLFALRGKGEL